MIEEEDKRDSVLQASPQIKVLLHQLHAENARQEKSFQRMWYKLKFTLHCLWNLNSRETWNIYCDL
jgi:hypothetical protein